MQDRQPLLEVQSLFLRFGGLAAIDDVSFSVRSGEFCALIGPNGAGKTSVFNCINRFYEPDAGTIRFEGTDLLGLAGHRLAGLGIARTFQELALFPSMSVRENVELATHCRNRSGWLGGALRTPAARAEDRRCSRRTDDVLELIGLTDVASRAVTGLPYGTLKRVELARAVASDPGLLLLDEPASGLTPDELMPYVELLRSIRAALDLTVLMIEHQMALVTALSDSVVVLDGGRVIATGSPDEIQASPVVLEAYLGAPA